MKRVVVTGLGVVSPIGNNVNEFWNNLINGVNGINYIKSFDTTNFDVKLGYEIKNIDMSSLPLRDQKFDSKYISYARIASKEAYENSLLDNTKIDKSKFGIYISSSGGGTEKTLEGINILNEQGSKRVSPYLLQSTLPNMGSSKVAIDLGAKGSNMSHVAACSSGAISIGEAYLKIKHGYEKVILAGASEASITELSIAGFSSLRAIYRGEDKEVASTPFDKRRNGFSIGEGAAILILEELNHALKRNANIYAEIVGYGCNCDANNTVSPDYEGLTCQYAIKDAIKMAKIKPNDIGYINAHGTSTILNDKTETKTIKKIFKNSNPYVSSTKGSTGHLLGASGAIEALITVKSLQENTFPYMINYNNKDNDCELNFILNKPLIAEIEYAISNSFGFGGHNACLVFKKWKNNENNKFI